MVSTYFLSEIDSDDIEGAYWGNSAVKINPTETLL